MVRPLPSMTHASSGTAASFPTAEITPRDTITVAFSIRGPETGTTVAFLIAKYCGSPPWARSCGAAASSMATAASSVNANEDRRRRKRMHDSLFWMARKDAIHRHCLGRRMRLVGSCGSVKKRREFARQILMSDLAPAGVVFSVESSDSQNGLG